MNKSIIKPSCFVRNNAISDIKKHSHTFMTGYIKPYKEYNFPLFSLNNEIELINYILSDDYINLLEKAVLARIGTTTNNFSKHEKAFELIRKYRENNS